MASQLPGAATLAPRQFGGRYGTVSPDVLSQIDFTNKSNLFAPMLATNIIAIVLIGVVVPLRLIVRRTMTGQFFLDDALIMCAFVLTIVLCSVSLAAMKTGLGQHVWNLPMDSILDQVKKCIQIMFVGNIVYACAIAFTKLSIIASYLRIFAPYTKFRYVLYATGFATVSMFLATVPATIFQCSPVAAAWDFSITDAKCFPFVNFLYASTAINIATDITLCTVPLPYFWKLQLPLKQKILVSGLFFVGGFASVALMIRLAFLHLLVDGIDVTYNLVSSLVWTIAESTIGIVCVSLPPLRPLFARLLPNIFTTRRTQRSRSGTEARWKSYGIPISSKNGGSQVWSGNDKVFG